MKLLKLSAYRALLLASGVCLGLALVLLTAGCAGGGLSTSPEIRWAQASSAFNAAVAQAIAARKPCVLYGEDAPDCLIKADAYQTVDLAIRRGEAVVTAVAGSTPGQNTADALLAIAAEIVGLIPVRR